MDKGYILLLIKLIENYIASTNKTLNNFASAWNLRIFDFTLDMCMSDIDEINKLLKELKEKLDLEEIKK